MRLFFTIFLMFSLPLVAQYKKQTTLNPFTATQSVNSNLKYLSYDNTINSAKKSTFLAGVLSFLVPGSGEIYTGYYVKGAVFVAIEAVVIGLNIQNNNKGDEQTAFYKSFANQNWDPAKYIRWSIKKFGIDLNQYPNLFTDASRTKIKSWSELNKLEDDISRLPGDNGKYYSHHLAPFGDQQYFEMIGKYQQFNVGWEDFSEAGDFNYGDELTVKYKYYSGERGKANEFYNAATTAMTVIIVNHVLSAIDAVISANWFNNNLNLQVEMKKDNLGYKMDYYPQLNIRYSF